MRLPAGAAVRQVSMGRWGGRDQVASRVARDGWEAFEAPLPACFYRVAQAWPGLVLDVGANTGFYTLIAAAAHRRNRVVACEPVPEILAALDENARANGFSGRVRRMRVAVAERNGTARLYMPPAGHAIETSASLRADFKPVHAGVLPVLTRTIDRILLRPSLVFRRLRIIKIDVEGSEAGVLAGAGRAVSRHRPVIFIEVLPLADLAALDRFLLQQRYADVVLRCGAAPLVAPEIAFHAGAWNHAFVPAEALTGFLALFAAAP